MAVLASQRCFSVANATPTEKQRLPWNKTQTNPNPPPNFSNFHYKTALVPSLKQFCKREGLTEAFRSLSNTLSESNSLYLFPEEAYGSVLEHCASTKALSQGKQVHACILKAFRLDQSGYLSGKLLFMYGKCGSFLDAEKLFDEMSERTSFSWNAMIGTYVSNAEPSTALKFYQEMRVSGVPVDIYSFPGLLKACGMLKHLPYGTEIHGLLVKLGHDSKSFVVNSLISMYAKCGDLNAVRHLFDGINEKDDVVLWNSVISSYCAYGKFVEALELLRVMQMNCIPGNSYTFVSALQACQGSSYTKLGMEIHAASLKSSYFLDMYVSNGLIAMYARCGKLIEAKRIFGATGEKDRVSWNSMITGFVQNSVHSEAVDIFRNMLDSREKPDEVSVTSVITASGRLSNLLNGMEAHAYAIKVGLDSNLQVGNTLIDMYAKCSYMDYMGRTFSMMPDKDFISWTTVIAGYAQNNRHLKAFELFRDVHLKQMQADSMMIGSVLLACSGLKCLPQVKEIHCFVLRRGLFDLVIQNTIVDVYGECGNTEYAIRMFQSIEDKDVVSWTSIISSCADNGLANEALKLFHQMGETGVYLDSIALACALSAAAKLSALKKGKEIHGYVLRKAFDLEGSISNALVDMYARSGDLDNASAVFSCTQSKGLVLYTSMINAYGMHGYGRAAIGLFVEMKNRNIIPDHITFLALLYACSHAGLIDEGRRYIEMMKHEYKLEPWPEHYACVVDLLGRSNRVEEAYEFVKNMKVEPTTEVWCALLAACRAHSKEELGEIAAQGLLKSNPKSPGNLVLVSNVFAERGRWKDVEAVRMRMKGTGLRKSPGCSWIELGNKTHSFLARDKSHPETEAIYVKLSEINVKLETDGGYVPETKFVLHNVDEEEKVQMIFGHSERLAIAYGMLKTPEGTRLRITKNLRVCGDCHTFCKLISDLFGRKIVVRDATRFHHFENGECSCGDFW